jgi:hypothetical protein
MPKPSDPHWWSTCSAEPPAIPQTATKRDVESELGALDEGGGAATAAARRLGFTAPDRAAEVLRAKLARAEDGTQRLELVSLLLRVGRDDDVDAIADDAYGTPFPADRTAPHAVTRLYFRERARLPGRSVSEVLSRLERILPRTSELADREQMYELQVGGPHILQQRDVDRLDRAPISAAANLLLAALDDERLPAPARRAFAEQLCGRARFLGDRTTTRPKAFEKLTKDELELARHLLLRAAIVPAPLLLIGAYWLRRRLRGAEAEALTEGLVDEGIDGVFGRDPTDDAVAAVSVVLDAPLAERVLVSLVDRSSRSDVRHRAARALIRSGPTGRKAMRTRLDQAALFPDEVIETFRDAAHAETFDALAPRLRVDHGLALAVPGSASVLVDPRFVDLGRELLGIDAMPGLCLLAALPHLDAMDILSAHLRERSGDDAHLRKAIDCFTTAQNPTLLPLLAAWLEQPTAAPLRVSLLVALGRCGGRAALPILEAHRNVSPGIVGNLIDEIAEQP